jgi:hypothetical protein
MSASKVFAATLTTKVAARGRDAYGLLRRPIRPKEAMPGYSFNDLADCLIQQGLEGAHVRAVKRYVSEAIILPPTSRGKPQTDVVHAVALLIACTAHDHQTRAVEALLDIWALKETHLVLQSEDPAGNLTHRAAQESPPGSPSFGRRVCSIISEVAALAVAGKPPEALCHHLMIWRGHPHAQILFPDRVLAYRIRFNGEGLRFKSLPAPSDRISVMARIPWSTLLALSSFVAESRRLATKQGLDIETASTWRALEPSGHGIFSPGNETAATPGREAAALGGQPAKRAGGVKHSHSTAGRETIQSPPKSRRRSPAQVESKRSNDDEREKAGPPRGSRSRG